MNRTPCRWRSVALALSLTLSACAGAPQPPVVEADIDQPIDVVVTEEVAPPTEDAAADTPAAPDIVAPDADAPEVTPPLPIDRVVLPPVDVEFEPYGPPPEWPVFEGETPLPRQGAAPAACSGHME